MAASEVSSLNKKKPPGFMTLLSSAACEWFLIFLLFLDALFSYLLDKFARYCDLQPPCPLCSRIDHFFGGETKLGPHWSILCGHHKEEISSLVSCSIHSNLVDVNHLCEECLTPIAMQNKSDNSESYKLLVGKLWVDVERSVIQNLMLNKSIRTGSSARRICSCCNKTWRNKSNAERLLELNPIGLGAKANIKPPLPRVPGRSRFSRRDSFMRLRDIFTGQISNETLNDVGYSKLKINSDSESEVPISEDDDDAGSTCSNYSNVIVKEKYRGCEVEPLIVDQPDLLDLSEGKNGNQDDFTWAESYHKPIPHLTEELISLDDIGGDSLAVSAEISNVPLPHMSALSVLSELLSLNAVPSSSDTVTIATNAINVDETAEETSLDDTLSLSESNKMKYIDDDLTQHILERKLSCKVTVDEPIKLREEMMMRSLSHVSTFDMNLLFKTPTTRKKELSSEQAFEPIGTEEEIKSPSQPSTSEVSFLPKNLPDNLTQSTEQGVEPIKAKEEMKPLSQVSTSEVGSKHDNLAQSTEKGELSCNHAAEPIKTEKEMKSLSQVSISEPGLMSKNLTDNFTYSTGKVESSHERAVEPIITQQDMKSVSQVSTSETGLSPKDLTDNLPQGTEERELSQKQADEPIETEECVKSVSQVSTSEADLSRESEVEPIKTEEETKSLSQASNSEAGLLSKKLNDVTESNEEGELSSKDEVNPIKTEEKLKSVSQVAPSDVGLWSKDTTPRATPRATSMKRNDSSYESLDEACVSDIEGENIIDRLKRQAEHDRNSLRSLYKELEEERNAAAISANQAMAMITRLQEEKAALHMEALQYLRMMEEQAEYDMEALQRANDLLNDREKELQDLECELEFYRNNLDDESEVEGVKKETPILEKIKSAKYLKENGNNSVPSFEDEKFYISQSLKSLESKLRLACFSGKLNYEVDETKNTLAINGGASHDIASNGIMEKSEKIHENGNGANMGIFVKEIGKLRERLETLENDRDFLKHAANLLRNGNDGLELIEEIAHQLQELRKMEFKCR